MSKFYTQYEPGKTVDSDPGDPDRVEYQGRYNSDGELELVPVGKTYIPDFVQSFAESVDINVILSRYANGDTDVLSQRQGIYVDAINMPHSFAELLNTVIDGQAQFDRLPAEIRAKFGNSFAEWMAAMDDITDFTSRMGYKPKSDPVKDDKEVEVDA